MISCKKINDTPLPSEKGTIESVPNGGFFFRQQGTVSSLKNQDLLKLVLSGEGGTFKIDTSYDGGPVDTSGYIDFPAYKPPVNSGGMLSFPSMSDYNSFILAAGLMENLWEYPDVDYEDSPQEIYHLGEESLNALDSALGFKSLRSQYELNEFYDHDWADTALLYVEDDDYQIALNQGHEVKVGSKYYKFVFNDIISIVSNSNALVLDSVRLYGIFVEHPDVVYYNEETGLYEVPSKQQVTGGTQSCSNFNLTTFAAVHYSNPANWVDLTTFVHHPSTLSGYPQDYRSVKGLYTIDWGDGVVENLVGNLIEVNYFKHFYQWPVSGFSIKHISVTCQLIPQSNPSNGYNILIQECPNLPNIIWSVGTTIKLDSYNYPECTDKGVQRLFKGIEGTVNGTRYRLDCKIKKAKNPVFWEPNIKATAKFTKYKNGSWKTTKSLNNLVIRMSGIVYKEYDCNESYHTINETKTKNKKNKIKNGTFGLIFGIFTKKALPLAINVDFVWKYNNNQTVVGNFNELLMP